MNKFERVPFFFNYAHYLTLGTFNVLIIQKMCHQSPQTSLL